MSLQVLYKCDITNQFQSMDQLFFTDRLLSADVTIQETTSTFCPVTYEQYSVKHATSIRNESPQSYLCPLCDGV